MRWPPFPSTARAIRHALSRPIVSRRALRASVAHRVQDVSDFCVRFVWRDAIGRILTGETEGAWARVRIGRSLAQPCSSHSGMAPATSNTSIAQPRSVLIRSFCSCRNESFCRAVARNLTLLGTPIGDDCTARDDRMNPMATEDLSCVRPCSEGDPQMTSANPPNRKCEGKASWWAGRP